MVAAVDNKTVVIDRRRWQKGPACFNRTLPRQKNRRPDINLVPLPLPPSLSPFERGFRWRRVIKKLAFADITVSLSFVVRVFLLQLTLKDFFERGFWRRVFFFRELCKVYFVEILERLKGLSHIYIEIFKRSRSILILCSRYQWKRIEMDQAVDEEKVF